MSHLIVRARRMLLGIRQRSILLRFLAFVLAVGVFVFDTLSPLQFAVAVLYAVVVLIAASYLDRRDLFDRCHRVRFTDTLEPVAGARLNVPRYGADSSHCESCGDWHNNVSRFENSLSE